MVGTRHGSVGPNDATTYPLPNFLRIDHERNDTRHSRSLKSGTDIPFASSTSTAGGRPGAT